MEAGLESGYLASAQPNELFIRLWTPIVPARAVLMICHGMGEHGGRYQPLAEFLLPHGFVVAVIDLPGHGKSAGRPAYVDTFDQHSDALGMLHSHLGERFPALPCFLLGHSMGGLIAANYLPANQHRLQGAVFSGACLEIDDQPEGFMKAFLTLLARYLPRLGVLKLDASAVSRDSAVVDDYEQDPLVFHGKIPARTVVNMFDAIDSAQRLAAKVELPLLLLHGSEDRLTAPQGSSDYQRNVSSADCDLKIYPGLYHEILNEPEREQVMQDVLLWLQSRLPVVGV